MSRFNCQNQKIDAATFATSVVRRTSQELNQLVRHDDSPCGLGSGKHFVGSLGLIFIKFVLERKLFCIYMAAPSKLFLFLWLWL